MRTDDFGVHDRLLHNMSAPPKTIVKYSGLADMVEFGGRRATLDITLRSRAIGLFGAKVRFALPPELKGRSPAFLLRHLGVSALKDSARQLVELINRRARELPLPDGCAVIPTLAEHPLLWTDTLTVLAVLTKCSDCIWLRDKSPAMSAALQHNQVTLLVPPLFASRLPKAPI